MALTFAPVVSNTFVKWTNYFTMYKTSTVDVLRLSRRLTEERYQIDFWRSRLTFILRNRHLRRAKTSEDNFIASFFDIIIVIEWLVFTKLILSSFTLEFCNFLSLGYL